jgi:hypothetical protein
LDYEIGEVTAAATFYLAEIYAHFGNALMTSERPEGLSPTEREQYNLAIEDQAYPFEEKAIAVHEDNLKLISRGVYNVWIEKSLQKLAKFVPARYDKPEETTGIISSLKTFTYEIDRWAPATPSESEVVTGAGSKPAGPAQKEEPSAVTPSQPAEPIEVQEPVQVEEPGQTGQPTGAWN